MVHGLIALTAIVLLLPPQEGPVEQALAGKEQELADVEQALADVEQALADVERRAEACAADPDATDEQRREIASAAVDVSWMPAIPAARVRGIVERLARAVRPLLRELPDQGEHEALFEQELASFALDRGDPSVAAGILADALLRWREDVGLLALDAERAMQQGEWEAAARSIDRAELILDAGTQGVDPIVAGSARLERILYEMRLGRTDQALIRLEEILADPATPRPVFELAITSLVNVQRYVDDPRGALASIARTGIDDPERLPPSLRLDHALSCFQLARGEERSRAIDAIERATDDDSLSDESRLAGMLTAAGGFLDAGADARAERRLDEARAILDRRASLGPLGTLQDERGVELALRARLRRKQASTPEDRRAADELAFAAFEALLEEWRTMPILEGGISFFRNSRRRAVVHEAISAALDRGRREGRVEAGDESAFGLLMQARALGSWARRVGLATPPLAEIRRTLLASGEGLLAFLVTDSGSHGFAVDGRDVLHFELADETTLVESANALLDAIDETSPDRDERHLAAAGRLADLLLPAPIREWLARVSLLRIDRGDVLADVPFEDLPLGGGETLGSRLALAYLPSVPIGVHLRERAAAPLPPDALDLVLVIGPATSPDGRSTFQLDPTRLGWPFARARPVAIPAEALARGAIEIGPARAAVFVGHGAIDRSRPRFSGLAIAVDAEGAPRVAWAEAFEGAALPPVVALAACSSADSPVRMGEDGATHLAGAALAGGATSVLAGRGEMDAEANLALLEAWLDHLARGAPPAEALRRARGDVESDPRVRSLARLELIGLGDEVIAFGRRAEDGGGSTRRRWPLVAGVVLLAAGAALLFARRRGGEETR